VAYSELIKNFERVRDYMRQFFVYGFKSRTEYDKKSARSYDNERRRIESWLGEYMSFRQDSNGKNVFLSVDSRSIPSNPLYNAFKAKSFTAGDITFHFYIMDILSDGRKLTIKEIIDEVSDEYLVEFEDIDILDESSVRKKLKEYVELGLLICEKEGRELRYSRATDEISLKSWDTALQFFSEIDPVGVIGSYLQDKLDKSDDLFRFKHQYMLHALDSDIVCKLLAAIEEKRQTSISVVIRRKPNEQKEYAVLPIKIYISTQTGRQYLLGYDYKPRRFVTFRIDGIHDVILKDIEPEYNKIYEDFLSFSKYLWGIAISHKRGTDHLEMTLSVEKGEEYIVDRVKREKRNGTVTQLEEKMWLYSVDCYDATELIPWIRTFTGRIAKLTCSNKEIEETFYNDFSKMEQMYGGEENAI